MSRRLTFHLIPHTHWDREWYLPRAAFQARLVPLLEQLLEQLDRDPDARFVLDGQTVMLEDFLAIRPELVLEAARQAELGALEIGPWYVLADELIPSGESLLRNLLLGSRDAARFGRRMDVLYSPDAFGHPAVLPALAHQFGIGRAVAWRGVGRPAGKDRDLHIWSGPSGESLLLYHLPPAGYSVGADLVTAEEEELPELWSAIRRELAARSATDQVAVFLGADHHAAPPDQSLLRQRIQQLEPEHEVRISSLTEYLDRCGGNLPDPEPLSGELRRIEGHTWVLQGVHGTRPRLKRLHSTIELELSRLTEPLAALAMLDDPADHRSLLRHCWRGLIQSQFHDTLGGCSADPVLAEQQVRLQSVRALSRELGERCWNHLAGHDPDASRHHPEGTGPMTVIWNPCPRKREGISTAALTFFRRDVLVGPPGNRKARSGRGFQPFTLVSESGEEIPVQVLAAVLDQERLDAEHHYPDQDEVDRVYVAFQTDTIPGLGFGRFGIKPSKKVPRSKLLEVGPDSLTNRFVAVSISPAGVITLQDRLTGERYPGLGALEDEPDAGDSYTYSRGRGRRARGGRAESRAIIAAGPLVGAVETRWTMVPAVDGELTCRLLAVLHADSPLLRLRFDIENRSRDHRLRARFAVGAGENALAGAAFGTELRPPVHSHSSSGAIERPVSTAPAHQFVAAAEYSRGLAIFAPGFFEYEWTADQDFAFTLLRAVGELSRADLPERPGNAGWPAAIPMAQEPGRHTIQLALAPVSEEVMDRPDLLTGLWEDAFLPMQCRYFRKYHGPPAGPSSPEIRLEGEGLICSAIKPAESGDGIVLRVCNLTSRPTEGRWILGRPIRAAGLARADETLLEGLPLEPDGRSFRFPARPFQLITTLVSLG